MRRLGARAALALLGAGAAFGLWSLRVSANNALWPYTGHHPRVLVFIAVCVLWVGAVIAVLVALVALVIWLWEQAR